MATSKKRNGNGNGGSNGKAFKTAAAAVAGGAGGALIGGFAVRSGVDVRTAAVGITAAGAMGALTLSGAAKTAAYGVAAAGAGQLALGWLATYAAKQDEDAAKKRSEEEAKTAQAQAQAQAEQAKRAQSSVGGYYARQAFESAEAEEGDDDMAA